MEGISAISSILFSPAGTFFLGVGTVALVYWGKLRLEREYKRLEAENVFLRGIVELQAGSQQLSAEAQTKQIALTELQVRGRTPV